VNILFGRFVCGRGAVGLLLARLVFGLGMTLHGSQKIGTSFTWMNAFFGEKAPPGFLQGLATAAEFFGGIALLVGLRRQSLRSASRW